MRPAQPKSRFAHIPRVLFRALLAVLPAVLLVTFLVVRLGHHAPPSGGSIALLASNPSAHRGMDETTAAIAARPIFRYSVVPGGVRDAQELQKAAAADPVVAKHYSDFKIAKSRTIQLNSPVEMYVSYRRNNQVYWTKNKMMIPAGETLISDGENLARVRCGNRLSPVAAKPVAATDPTQEELETLEFIPPMLAGITPNEGGEFFPGGPGAVPVPGTTGSAPGGSGPNSTSVLPPFLGPGIPPLIGSIQVPPTSPPPPPVGTPEPGSFSLLFAGGAFFALLAVFTLRRNGTS